MSYFELRQYIEQSVPWWVPIVVPAFFILVSFAVSCVKCILGFHKQGKRLYGGFTECPVCGRLYRIKDRNTRANNEQEATTRQPN